MKVIGVTGFAQHGKDTVARWFIENKGFTKRALADAIKEGCKGLFGFSEEQVNGYLKDIVDPFWGVTPRRILQVMGTEIFREKVGEFWPELKYLGGDFWLKRMEKFIIDNAIENGVDKDGNDGKIIIPDCRFENEVNLIRKFNGILIKVKRGDRIVDGGHASENGLDDDLCDYVILNNRTIEELNLKLKGLFGDY